MFSRFVPRGVLLLAVLGLAACGKADLYTNVSEREANEMLVTLSASGVEATKKPGADDLFVVSAPSADFAYAMQVLTAADFPRDQNDAMAELLKKKSLVSPEAEQRMRANAILTEGLNRTLSQIDGVQVARVHVVTPAKNRMGQSFAQPTASVFIKHRQDADLASETAQVKMIVANAVEDLAAANVSVALFAAAPVPVRAEPPVEQAAAELAAPVLGSLGALALGFAGLRAVRRRPAKTPAEIEGPSDSADG